MLSIMPQEYEVLTAVVMKGSIFWDITPFSPLKVNRCFGEMLLPLSELQK
jgi:hypothetical protein